MSRQGLEVYFEEAMHVCIFNFVWSRSDQMCVEAVKHLRSPIYDKLFNNGTLVPSV